MNQPTQPQACGYSIDADPQGIRALTADAIHGALAFGFQGVNPPPEGHWLTMFWQIGRDAQSARPTVADCEHCDGTGEVLAHAENCHDDLCALNGDEHSCVGRVEPCSCAAQPMATESILIEGVAYDVPAPVAGELLRLHLELQGAAGTVPDGFKMVPLQPTKEMIDAGYMHTMMADEQEPYRARGAAIACYSDMLDIAPEPPKEPGTITLTLEQARTLAEALDVGLGAAGAAAANYHESMAGYRPERHKAMDEDAAKVNGALTLLSGLIQAATGEEEVEHG